MLSMIRIPLLILLFGMSSTPVMAGPGEWTWINPLAPAEPLETGLDSNIQWSPLLSPVATTLKDARCVGDALLVVGEEGVMVVKGSLPTVAYKRQYVPMVMRKT